jgi:hypothetical protein
MATITELSDTLDHWIRHMRTQRALTWSLRGLIAGLALALIIGLVGLVQLQLLRNEFLILVILSSVLTASIAAVIAYLWPIQPLFAARYFDRTFHLGERVSTALELGRNSEQTGLIHRQLEDALRASRTVKPAQHLPLRVQRRDLRW